MTEEVMNAWHMPSKVKGINQIPNNEYRDEALQRALMELSRMETARLKKLKEEGLYYGNTNVSVATIIINLAIYPSTFTRTMSARLKQRYNYFKKEQLNHGKFMDIKRSWGYEKPQTT